MNITIDINGKDVSAAIEPRLTLLDFVRDVARLKGTTHPMFASGMGAF